jgi:hypothetical protein
MPGELDARGGGVDIDELRQLIVAAAPEPALAEPALACGVDVALDSLIPFSSVIVLGVIVAVEDAYGIRVTKPMLAEVLRGGATLRTLAQMIEAAR